MSYNLDNLSTISPINISSTFQIELQNNICEVMYAKAVIMLELIEFDSEIYKSHCENILIHFQNVASNYTDPSIFAQIFYLILKGGFSQRVDSVSKQVSK